MHVQVVGGYEHCVAGLATSDEVLTLSPGGFVEDYSRRPLVQERVMAEKGLSAIVVTGVGASTRALYSSRAEHSARTCALLDVLPCARRLVCVGVVVRC